MNKKKRLGKGLSALLKTDIKDEDLGNELNENLSISIKKILTSNFQARRKFDQEKLERLTEC